MRESKKKYYLDIAQVVSTRSTCVRRHYGAVIVKDDRVVATGYNGAPRGRANCCDLNDCIREQKNIPRGTRYELCRSVHAEMNAIINCSPTDMGNATLYLVGTESDGSIIKDYEPCAMCKRAIINSGISIVECLGRTLYTHDWVVDDDSLSNKEGY